MNLLPRILLFGLAVAALAHAQGNSQNNQPNRPTKTPDTDWANVTALVTPARPSPGTRVAKTRAEIDAAAIQTAAQFKQAGQAAKDFYSAYPADPRAPLAKKLEATSLLKGTLPTDADHSQAAFQVAAAYRTDPGNSAKDRFEVAALAESQRYLVQTNGHPLADNPATHERVADALRAEFGDTAEAAAFYLGVADSADFETGHRVANKILQLPATDAVRRQAQMESDRFGLIGKPFEVSLRAQDGKRVDLKAPGSVTVLYVWSERHGANPWSTLARAKPAVPPGMRWVYLALDTTPGEMADAMSKAPFAGTPCVVPGGPKSAALKSLKVRRVPFVYVIDANGMLAGYGPPALLPALLLAASR